MGAGRAVRADSYIQWMHRSALSTSASATIAQWSPKPDSCRQPHGLVPDGGGWFVLNARAASWRHAEGRTALTSFEGETPFAQIGINLSVLGPGEAMGMYRREADQEDFLVLAGEPIAIVAGEERALRPWDLVHCPPEAYAGLARRKPAAFRAEWLPADER